MIVKPLVIDQRTIRTENRKKILQLLIRKRELTIPEISREIDISTPTITKNINQLMIEGMAEEAGVSESTGGRKPMVIKFLPDAYYSVGVEFALEYVHIILTNLDTSIKADRVIRNVNYHDLTSLMTYIHREINSIFLEKEIPVERVLGVGISIPGTVNEETVFVKIAPNIGVRNADFRPYEDLFQLPLFLENDANAAAIAELVLGIAKEMRNLVFLCVLPQGIGAGIVVDGHLYKGKNKRAGEISHTTIASHGKICSCGRRDCWELYASGNTLLTRYQEKTGKVLGSLEEFFVVLKRYELAAVKVFDEYLDYLALGIQNLILIQDPHYVILGGVISPYEEILLEPLKKKVFVENNFYDMQDVQVMCSTLRENASILGASLLPFEKIFALHDM